nr:hypothetical protein GCM10011355_26240 [Aquisalinus luteolus]
MITLACAASASLLSAATAQAQQDPCTAMVGVGGDWVMQPFGFDEAGVSTFIFAKSFAENYTQNGLKIAPSEKKVLGSPDAGETYLTLLMQGRLNPANKVDISWESASIQISNIVSAADGTKPQIAWMSDKDDYAYLMDGNKQLAMTDANLVVTVVQSGIGPFMDAVAEGRGEIRFCHGERSDYSTCLSMPVGDDAAKAAVEAATQTLRTRSTQYRESGSCQ